MVSKNELEKQKQMNEALKKVDNKWEALAFVWAYRRRELLLILNALQLCVIIVLLGKYTKFFEIIGQWFVKFIGVFAK